MLSVLEVQVLAAVSLIGSVAALIVGGQPRPRRSTPSQVVARREPGRGTEALWLAASAVSVFWTVGVLLDPRYAYNWPTVPDVPLLAALQLVGFLVSVAGGALFLTSARSLGRFMTPAIQVREDHHIVQAGPYRRIRHPVYTAIVTSAFGLSLLFLSAPLLVVALLLMGLAQYRARLEEELLSSPEAFGREYTEYMSRTGRFLPRWR